MIIILKKMFPCFAGKSNKISTGTIVAIVVPIVAAVLLVFLACCFLRKRAKKKYNAIDQENGVFLILTMPCVCFLILQELGE